MLQQVKDPTLVNNLFVDSYQLLLHRSLVQGPLEEVELPSDLGKHMYSGVADFRGCPSEPSLDADSSLAFKFSLKFIISLTDVSS